MTEGPEVPDTTSSSDVVMSWEAIWQRLRLVDDLNELCRDLSEYHLVQVSRDTEA